MDIDDTNLMFHFTKTLTGLDYIIANKRLKFNSLVNLNDAKEYSKIFHKFVNYDDPLDLWGEDISEQLNEQIKKKYGIICFCSNIKPKVFDQNYVGKETDLFQPAWKRSRMWTQYADNNSGLCFIFQRDRISNIVSQNHQYSLGNVSYRYFDENDPVIHDIETLDIEKVKNNREEYIDSYIKKYFSFLFYTKNVDYRDEAECRLLTNDISDNYFDISDSLFGIIIGHRTPNKYHSIISERCKGSKIKCYKMGWKNGAPIICDWSDNEK